VIRATLDANVLVSGFVGTSGPPTIILQRWTAGEFTLVLSEHILNGAERAWRKPYFTSRYSLGQANQALTLLRRQATMVSPISTIQGIGADEEDDLVLATAVAGAADYLVTGDRHLQALLNIERSNGTSERSSTIPIVSPRWFLDRLDQS
jgi:putative PIN family toxin of toxin-antitoxin system